jgi:hypothetical protein
MSIDYKKKSSKLRRKRKREEVQATNGTPGVKAFHLKRRDEALGAAIQDESFQHLIRFANGTFLVSFIS